MSDTFNAGDQNRPGWMNAAPYKAPSDSFDRKHNGQCHCGQIKYSLSRDAPLDSKYCHCHNCQIIHGAPFQWAAIFHKTDIAFVDLHDGSALKFYNSGGENDQDAGDGRPPLPCKVSCRNCGTLLMDEGRNMVLLFPTTLKLKGEAERKKFEVQSHIFYPWRVVDIPDGKPKWSGLDGKSERVD